MKNIHISKIYTVVYIEPLSSDVKRAVYGKALLHNELIFKLSGDSFTSFNRKKLHNTPNSIRILPQSDNIEYYVDFIEPGACIDIYFDTVEALDDEAYIIDVTNNLKFKELFFKIYRLWTRKQNGYYNQCLSLLYEIFGEIEKTRYNLSSKTKQLEKGVEYLSENALSQEIDYLKPAAICNVCPTYFRRKFKIIFGISPSQYVRKIRIDYAKELLMLNQYSVSEIAAMTGYENVYYFSRIFKEITGMSPTEFRKKA